MKSGTRNGVLIGSLSRALAGALLAMLLFPATPIHAEHSERQGRISGKVIDEKGGPLAGVRVTITTKSLSSFRKELTTWKDGTWATFLADATLTYHYLFEKPGYVAVEKYKKVPFWNPSDYAEPPGMRSGDLSVLDIQLFAQAPAVEKAK